MGSRRRAGAVAGALLLAGSLLAGCANIPTGGRPVAVRNVPPGAVGDEPDVRQEPREPGTGDSPDRVVRGFLAAAKSATEGHAIARAYLTLTALDGWKDSAGTRIISLDNLRVEPSGAPGRVQVLLTGRYQARIADDGAYVPDDSALRVTYELRQVAGEWRIDNPPPGVLLPADDFQQVYKAVDLYFISPDGQTVVPDRRYFDVKQGVLATRMTNRLLAGPSDWLSAGVRTAFPAGTRLRSNVVLVGDVLLVDLSSEVLAASHSDQVALAAQLVWTLTKRFAVRGVQLLADGRPLRLLGANGVLDRQAYSSYDPRVLTTRVPGYFLAAGSLRSTGDQPVTGPAAAPHAGLTSVAVSADLGRLAAIQAGPAGARLLLGPLGGPLVPRYAGAALSRPAWETGAGAVYVVVGRRAVWRVPVAGAAQQVRVPGLERLGPPSSIALSRDGVRVALIAGPPAGGRLYVGVLTRAGRDVSIGKLQQVAPQVTQVADVAWASEGEMLVLGRRDAGPVTPYLVDVDGATVTERPTAGLPADRRALAAAPDEVDLVQADARIWRRSGSTWLPVRGGDPGSAPVYPG
ncbi:MAG: LpqB family beta-propeller domain-containing protein [Actinomycetota bacterium]|nr:LpqB family beta-propeller domain-containing protein [Actinomycetota bacterium]